MKLWFSTRKKNCFIVSLRFHLWPALIPRHLIYGIAIIFFSFNNKFSLLASIFCFCGTLFDCRFYWFFFVCPFFLKKKFRRLGETRGIKFPGFRVDSNFARNRPGGRGARYTEKVGTWVSSAGYRQQIGSSYPSFPLILEFFSSFIYFNYFKSFWF